MPLGNPGILDCRSDGGRAGGSSNEGTPQGRPLSPLLSNIVLDELDRELEQRGHRFVRYADDCNIYVRSQRAGERVMENITRFIAARLKLKVNGEESAVAEPRACPPRSPRACAAGRDPCQLRLGVTIKFSAFSMEYTLC